MNLLVLLGVAIAPGAVTVIYICSKDKFKPEPRGLLVLSFVYGLLSVVLTVIFGILLSNVLVFRVNDIFNQLVKAFVVTALVEEISKFIFVRFILYTNKNFDEPFDGIVYAVMVGMGFATLENVLYVFYYGLGAGILRMFTAVPMHATCAIIMGYFLGKAKFAKQKESYYISLGLFMPVILHGTYDFFLFISFVPGMFLGAFVSLVVGVALARNAIELHQQMSPFSEDKS